MKQTSPMTRRIRFGPGFLVTAAFIGPGTVTTASIAGATYGTALLWAIVFAIIATTVLQEMSARLGLVTRTGLGEAMRSTFDGPSTRVLVVVLVIGAIAVGNAAFEMGNIMGAAIGMELLSGWPARSCALLVGIAAALLLYFGGYRLVERLFVILVAAMGCTFLLTAIIAGPDWGEIFTGILSPSIPANSIPIILGLIGTTVVPYNLFLHASTVQEKWPVEMPIAESLKAARIDTAVSITFGGLITMAILITASVAHSTGVTVTGAADMASQLEPLLGGMAGVCFAIGLTAAGLTSALTAPLAAAYATSGIFGFSSDTHSLKFRAIWGAIVAIGMFFALIGTSPVEAIFVAQIINGALLPIAAVFLLIVLNRSRVLGEYRNHAAANILGAIVVLVAIGLGLRNILRTIGWMN